jgi:rhomboid family GlyGly-CTERM serine protease
VTLIPRKVLKSLLPEPASILFVPALVGLMSALAELGSETIRTALRYDRGGLESGQLWRLVTGHIVHLGPSHMVMNVIALGVLALVLSPYLRGRDWIWVGLGAAFAIDGGLYWVNSAVEWYVGLSGVLHGFCILGVASRRFEAFPLALLLIGKLAYEAFIGAVPLTGEIAAGPVVTVAHAWGAAGGALAAGLIIAIRGRRPSL